MSYFPRNHSGYQPLPVPMPAAEDRLYPSLENRDYRVLPPPVDAPVTAAVAPQLRPLPSAPVFGVIQNAPMSRPVQLNAVNAGQYQQLPVMQNNAGYAALPRNEMPAPAAIQFAQQSQPGAPASPGVSQPFISDNSQTPPPTIEELEDRIKNSQRTPLSIQSMMNYAWRFFTKNICAYCGMQMLMLLVVVVAAIIIFVFAASLFSVHVSGNYHYKGWIFVYLFEFGMSVFFLYPLFLALSYATLRAIQQNRFLIISDFFKFYSLQYCNCLCFSFLTCLFQFVAGFIPVVGWVFQIIYLWFLALSVPFKFQFPAMRTFKAWRLSIRVSAKNWPKMLLLCILVIVLNILAALAFFVGLFVTVPLTTALYIYVYQKLVGIHSVSGYAHVEGRPDEYSYDGTGFVSALGVRPPTHPLQQQQPGQPMQYVQLVPMVPLRMGANGVPMQMQMQMVPAPAGGPVMVRGPGPVAPPQQMV